MGLDITAYRNLKPVRKLTEDEAYEGKPFARLIHFADNEGTIGTNEAKKLAKDFADWEDAFMAHVNDAYAQIKYREWRKAFEMAADNGAVSFH